MIRRVRDGTSTPASVRKLRCAVYTRVSTDEQATQEYNSLHAQRDASEAFVASQRAEGWVLVPDHYDDGGISGATLERPALQRLLRDKPPAADGPAVDGDDAAAGAAVPAAPATE